MKVKIKLVSNRHWCDSSIVRFNQLNKNTMKLFTTQDVDCTTQFKTIYADKSELVYSPLQWQKLGLQQTASGYGRKLNSGYKINFNGKLYRLYVTCFSNCGTTWFVANGVKYHVN